MLFVISEDRKNVESIEAESFSDLSIREERIQEWIRAHPEILDEDLLIVSKEFDRFEGARDRLDLLAIDREGNLVIVELKRDQFAAYADLQSIRYAAMISTLTVDELLPYYVEHHRKFGGQDISEEDLREEIEEFVVSEDFEELSNKPRIILCSQDFSQEITTTALWLREFDVDISCVKITPHNVGGKTVIVSEKIIPLRESNEYLTGIKKKEEQRQEAKRTPYLTLDEICAKADEEGIGNQFRRILETAQKHQLWARVEKSCIRYTSPANYRSALFTVWLKSARPGGNSLRVRPENFSEFYPIDFETVKAAIGPEGYRDAYVDAEQFAVGLDKLFEDMKVS